MTGKAKTKITKERFLHDALLEWFTVHRRTFPWREGQIDPFVSLVTELLLQRTKADVVATFYPVVLERLSTPAKILARDRGLIVGDLSTLGLQDRRTESLKSLASTIQEDYGGIVPPDEEKLLELNGIGRYIARAVLCFAFGKPVSIVDGNVTRVFCKFFGMENKGDNRRNKAIWEKADEIIALDPGHVKEFNWAVLDFGAMVCMPRSPGCDGCCLKQMCFFKRRMEKE
jgi:A/G-specific adenine glycosylase